MAESKTTAARGAEAQADFLLGHYAKMGSVARMIFAAKLNAQETGAVWTPDYDAIDRITGALHHD